MRILGNRILIAPLPAPTTSANGLHLPVNYNDPRSAQQYRVEAVGPGRRLKTGVTIPPEVMVGDYVLAPLHHDHITLDDGRKIVDASEILMRWRPSETP